MNKRITGTVLAVLTAIMFVLSAGSVFAEAVELPDMQKANVAWDLEPDKPVTSYTRFVGIEDYVPVEAVITDWEQVKTGKGTVKLSFTITFTDDFEPTDDQISMIVHHKVNSFTGGYFAWTENDYSTGMCLEVKNKLGVIVKCEEIAKETKECTASDGSKLQFDKKLVESITVEYPEDYDGLCIGILGCLSALDYTPETNYWNGKGPFSKTIFYSPSNANLSHFMRVTSDTLSIPAP